MRERYLSIPEVADLLGTTERFPRRLVAERRITFVKVGVHVRIAESVLFAYIKANTVETVRPRRRARRAA
ncbi:helix-turn-helix domain-containing protein [Streptomyces sp. NPDC079189]|uniref:helix-turn-helix domain-containing protein n=1 Tax=Streptomyces sp. NPDC079189 TaxID=3154514 RepID=UPI00342C3620